MSQFYEITLPIDSRDVDGLGRCKPSALLGHMQEAATRAAYELGVGRDELIQRYNAFWMLVRMWFRLERPLHWSENLTVRTWHRGDKSAMMYRDYDLLVDGKPVGEGVSVWVLAGLEDRSLKRLAEVAEMADSHGGELRKSIKLSKLRHPDGMLETERRLMRYSDTDINAHVNNTRYADFICDALAEQCMSGDRFLSQMQLGYTAECRVGELLSIQTGQEEEKRFVCGVDEAGKMRFEGMAIFSEDIH